MWNIEKIHNFKEIQNVEIFYHYRSFLVNILKALKISQIMENNQFPFCTICNILNDQMNKSVIFESIVEFSKQK